MAGAATVLPPLHRPFKSWKVGHVGVFLKSSEGGKSVRNRGEKKIFFSLFSTRPGEEDDGADQNGPVSGFFFLNSV